MMDKMKNGIYGICFAFGMCCAFGAQSYAKADIMIDDFESGYGNWLFEGDADTFGEAPATGNVQGFNGRGLVNSAFTAGNAPVGKMKLKKPFKIEHDFLTALVAGGFEDDLIYLRVVDADGNEIGRVTGHFGRDMRNKAIDLRGHRGKNAIVEIADLWDNEWEGRIFVDDIKLTDTPDLTVVQKIYEGEAEGNYLIMPVKLRGGNGNKLVKIYDTSNPDAPQLFYKGVHPVDFNSPELYVGVHTSRLKGKNARIIMEHSVNEDAEIIMSEKVPEPVGFPDEEYRPQYHFTAEQGYLNDPNGLVFWKGKWHLFFQYTPTSIYIGKKSWGHAVSDDLMTWKQLPPAIDVSFFDGREHNAFSGTAFADPKNKSGLFEEGKGGVVFAYTSTESGEHIAFSDSDMLEFPQEMEGNPVVVGGGRDPRIFFHKPSGKWVMIRYDERYDENIDIRERAKLSNVRKMFTFLVSDDLKNWEEASNIPDLFECPDFFEIKVEGKGGQKKSVMTDASGRFFVGSFDGRTFKMEGEPLPRIFHGDFYAIQHYENAPEDRIIIHGFIGQDIDALIDRRMPFSQAISLPMEVKLNVEDDGSYYMTALPPKEFNKKVGKPVYELESPVKLSDLFDSPVKAPSSSVIDVEIDMSDSAEATPAVLLDNIMIGFDRERSTLKMGDINHPQHMRPYHMYDPKKDNILRLKICVDRSIVSVYYGDGKSAAFKSFLFGRDDIPVSVSCEGGVLNKFKISPVSSMYKGGKGGAN